MSSNNILPFLFPGMVLTIDRFSFVVLNINVLVQIFHVGNLHGLVHMHKNKPSISAIS